MDKMLAQIADASCKVEEAAIKQLLTAFPIDEIVKFRKGGGICYVHERSGVGFQIFQEYDESSVTFVAVPGVYEPDRMPPED